MLRRNSVWSEALTHDKQTPKRHCSFYSKQALIYFTNMILDMEGKKNIWNTKEHCIDEAK